MKNVNATQYLFRLSEKFLSKYAQEMQVYHVEEMERGQDPATARGTPKGTVEAPARSWDAAATIAARRFYGLENAERVAGTQSGLFYLPEIKTYITIE